MISVLIPSRSRPDQASRGYKSLIQNAAGQVEVIFYLNNCDPALKYYDVPSLVGPDQPTSYSWNYLAKQAQGDILMMGGDDSVMMTKNWDRLMEEAVDEDEISFIAPADGRGEGRPHWAITRKWYETVGYFVWPEMVHFYVDTWNNDIAKKVGREHYLSDVMYEHWHAKTGKAPWDYIYERVRINGSKRHDAEVFKNGEQRRVEDANKLKEAMNV